MAEARLSVEALLDMMYDAMGIGTKILTLTNREDVNAVLVTRTVLEDGRERFDITEITDQEGVTGRHRKEGLDD